MSTGALVPRVTAIVMSSFALTACAGLPEIPYVNPPPPAAAANLVDASGRIAGHAVLIQDGNAVRILLDVNGLAPGAKAVHIHEVGQCTGPSFSSAGGHFNPTRAEHGTKNPRGPHAGDLPDVTVEASGRGHMEVTATRLSLKKGTSMIDADGAAIVVHERGDDERTDPDGGSGTRIACGVLIPSGKT
ncbi:MAG: superoxide dismutase family protein [Gammaproteobacteria bacterium]